MLLKCYVILLKIIEICEDKVDQTAISRTHLSQIA